MSPIILCVLEKLNNDEIKDFSKVSLKASENILADIGLGKDIKRPKSIINEELDNASFYCNINLISAINHAKENKSKVHIIGDINKDKNVLDAIIKVAKDLSCKNVYLHLFSNKKINVKSILKEYGIAKVANTFDIELLDTNTARVYEAVVKNKKMENSVDLNSSHVSNNDTVIFYNLDVSKYSLLIDSLVAKNFNIFDRRNLKNLHVMSVFNYGKLPCMYEVSKNLTLGEYISNNNLKQLRYNIDSYSFDGYQYKGYKGTKIINDNILDVDLTKYDFVITKVSNKDFKKLEAKANDIGATMLVVVDNIDEPLFAISKDIKLEKGTAKSICATIIELLGLKPINDIDNSLLGHRKELIGFIFRAVSIIFVIGCVTVYMARFLHFYLTK